MKFPTRHSATGQTAAAIRRNAEHAAARLPPLMVQADRIAATIAQGVHGRRRVGRGDTFWQFRRYQSGDAAASIDWRQSAKTQAHYVRETEWDAAQSVWLWQDTSPSMSYRADPENPDKAERAAVLTLALASLLVRGGEQVALLGQGQPPSNGRSVLNRIADHLSRGDEDGASLPARLALPRHARLVLIGDLLSPVAELAEIVRGYAAMGVHGHMLQVLDPSEETLPFNGRIRFEGLEGEGATLIGRVEMVRGDYVALLDAHRRGLSDLARSLGWSFATHRTDRPPHAALLALYGALSENPV